MKKYYSPRLKQKKISLNFFTRNSRWDFGSMFETSILYAYCDPDPNCSRTCFLAGTKIHLSNSLDKSIEHMKPGDVIKSYSFKESKFIKNKVLELLIHKNLNGYLLINNEIKVTEEHLFWNTKEWVRAKDLKIGDKIFNIQGTNTKISKIRKINGTNKVYNLHLEVSPHNYFAENLLVHNYK